MNSHEKEIHFFDRYYERGVGWYERFFPAPSKASRYQAIGEFTPTYLFDERCLERISRFGAVERLVVTLRDPVERAISNYWHRVRLDNYRRGIIALCQERPFILKFSRYAEPLGKYIDAFGRQSILILIYEEMVQDGAETKRRLAEHLGVEEGRFPQHTTEEKVNHRFTALRPGVASTVARAHRWLRDADAEWALRAARAIRVHRAARHLMGAQPSPIEVSKSEIEWLRDNLAAEVYRTEALLGRQIPGWHRVPHKSYA